MLGRMRRRHVSLALRVAAAIGFAAPLGACAISSPDAASPTRPRATEAAHSRPGPSLFTEGWRWRDEGGKNVTFSSWRGSTLVVAVIYTSCSTVCPRTVGKLRKVEEAFRRGGRTAQFLLVTLDPTTDTPERLRDYKVVERLPESWHLLTGSPGDTRALTDALDIHLIDMGSHVFHETNVAVFDEAGLPVRTFRGIDFEDAAAVR
jgi:protein SCO1/2